VELRKHKKHSEMAFDEDLADLKTQDKTKWNMSPQNALLQPVLQ
jgi:hypothetical protein